jgi:hypothetical protein
MQETEDTGVIYMITNKVNKMKYIGKAFSYVKNGKQKIRKHGAQDRLYKHVKAALNNSNDIPLLYEDMRKHGTDNFTVETLEVCLKENLKARETHYTKLHKTCEKEIGYNYHVGDNKPKDKEHVKQYEENKVLTNKTRAIDGKLRQSDEVKDLPPNVYKRANGLFAQIKINGTLYNKAFLSSKDSDEEKLKQAKLWLANTKQQYGDIEV